MAKLRWCMLPVLAAVALGASPASAQGYREYREYREYRDTDEPRFRGGVSLGGGGLLLSDYSLGLAELQGRLGVQLNHLVGIYAEPYLSLGGGNFGGTPALFGTIGALGMVDFTFLNQIFVGAGGGGGLFQNTGEGQVRLRFGGYPFYVRGPHGRRKGLMLGADMTVHVFSSGGQSLTLLQPTFNIGYEAY